MENKNQANQYPPDDNEMYNNNDEEEYNENENFNNIEVNPEEANENENDNEEYNENENENEYYSENQNENNEVNMNNGEQYQEGQEDQDQDIQNIENAEITEESPDTQMQNENIKNNQNIVNEQNSVNQNNNQVQNINKNIQNNENAPQNLPQNMPQGNNIEDLEEEGDDEGTPIVVDFNTMITKLRKLFEYYCQYGERLNTKILKSFKFIKISKEANIMDNLITTTRLELIYKTENKYNNMNFDQFLNCLMHIAEVKYQNLVMNQDDPNMDKKEKISTLINEHFLPLYQEIFNENNKVNSSSISNESYLTVGNAEIESVDDILYTKITQEILTSVCPVLFNIYKVYFTNELSVSEDLKYIKDTSLKNFFNFIRDFDIAPGLLSKPICYKVYQAEIVNESVDESIEKNKEFYFRICKRIEIDYNINVRNKPRNKNFCVLGRHFIFYKFVRTLVKLSDLAFKRLNFKDLYPFEKLIMFFQKIELSDGFQNFELKTFKTHSDKNSCIVNQELIEKINYYLELQKEEDKKSNCGNANNKNNTINNENENVNKSKINESYYQNILPTSTEYLMNDNYNTEYSNYINETYGEDLLHIFKGICNFGDQLNYKYMKSEKFFKFLSQANLVRINGKNNFGLKLNDIDTLFIKLSLLNRSMKQSENDLNSQNNNLNTSDMNQSVYSMLTTSQRNEETKNLALKVISRRNMFKKPVYKNTQAKIDFNTFIIGIEIISKAIYPNIPVKDAIDKVVNNHIFANLAAAYDIKTKSIDEKIEVLKELQSNEEYIKVLEITYKAMSPIFKFYTKTTNGEMNFKQFMKFAQDFEIFPGIISKAKLNGFFGAISQYSCDEDYLDDNMSNRLPTIEQSLFIDILALIANDIIYPEPDPNPVEKILILMEKISGSEGPERITTKTGKNRMMSDDPIGIVEEFKKAYPDYFEVKEHKKEGFIDFMLGDK